MKCINEFTNNRVTQNWITVSQLETWRTSTISAIQIILLGSIISEQDYDVNLGYYVFHLVLVDWITCVL